MLIDGIDITADFDASTEELQNYVDYVTMRVDEDIISIRVKMRDDGTVDVDYNAHGIPFERIRRITGYLTGDLTSWNDAKQAEEHDRVKHEPRI